MTAHPSPAPEPGDSPEAASFGRPRRGWRRAFFVVIFESNTRAGKVFDVALILAIFASVAVVMLDSVQSIGGRYPRLFLALEWGFTLLFTAEYLARLACVQRPARYAKSFFGVVDLLAILPTYLAFFFPGLRALMDVRLLRVLRVFRILKLTAYMREYRSLGAALAASKRRILVFLGTVAIVVFVLGTVMYVVEGPENGFTSIPVGVYWAVSTMSTVGFGDIVPKTGLGRTIASFVMLLGWGVLAVPTGIVTAEITRQRLKEPEEGPRRCDACASANHAASARYCRDCGAPLPER